MTTGSFNFTRAAEESNVENVLRIRSKELAREYSEDWERNRSHSGGIYRKIEFLKGLLLTCLQRIWIGKKKLFGTESREKV